MTRCPDSAHRPMLSSPAAAHRRLLAGSPSKGVALRGLLVGCAICLSGCVVRPAYYRIKVVDAQTGRGIPLVELQTTHEVRYVTDSAGVIAIDEPTLWGKQVYFHARSHGYELPADRFGFRGVRIQLEPDGKRVIQMRRLNIAERLYRVTGADIYRDSLLLGEPVPLEISTARGGVFGQDSVVNAIYQGRLYWFWGDTERADLPLGNFQVSGATSSLPGQGGLDPTLGVALDYFVGPRGFSRPMCPIQGPGAVWISGLMVLDRDGAQRMLCHYARMRDVSTRLEHGIALWNDRHDRFDKHTEFPLEAPLHPRGHPVELEIGGERWLYFANPYALIRVRARMRDVVDPSRYEAYTCLSRGARWPEDVEATAPSLERNERGTLIWAWKPDTATVDPKRWRKLVQLGAVAEDEGWMTLHDTETGDPVDVHGGSVSWNGYRNRWVMIALQSGGHSALGEVWYAESKHLHGPWSQARRIITHDRYSFYNVKQHPYFAKEDGRLIYLEGTYTTSFSGGDRPTPRYDYNQIMYRLDLADERLPHVE
ncbi:MAG: hypothetical protein OXR73_28675 [Myxococcales bacterium]|nr:hypothetical protein [Myxococcales bacterium]